MFRIISAFVFGIMTLPAFAGGLSGAACEKLLMVAEETPNPSIYDDCDFGNEQKAWNEWAPFAAAYNMKRALFELCRRYPNHIYGNLYCEKAIALHYGPALAYRGHQSFDKGDIEGALNDFNQALKLGDLEEDEVLRITERLGILYSTEGTDHFSPRSGIALLVKAANGRSAVANNALGYLSYSGKNGLKKNPQKALEFFWRAILYGCPAAEENLGAFHLARQGKISEDDAAYYMSLQAMTCKPFDKTVNERPSPMAKCDCAGIREKEALFKTQPYQYIEMDGERVMLKDKNNQVHTVKQRDQLPDGSVVFEIKPTLVTLDKKGQRVFVNRYHAGQCVDYCLRSDIELPKRKPVGIRPYHLTFTKQECADIAYYAKRLIDTSKPYVGKEECLGPEMDETTKLLLNIQ